MQGTRQQVDAGRPIGQPVFPTPEVVLEVLPASRITAEALVLYLPRRPPATSNLLHVVLRYRQTSEERRAEGL